MASGTITPPKQPESPKPPAIKYATYIEDRLQYTRRQVKVVEVASGLMILVAGTLTYFLAVAVLDHWVVAGGLGFFSRLLLWGGWIAAGGVFFWRYLLPPIAYRVNPIYAAQTIEHSRQTLKNSLINLLLFRGHREEVSPVVYQAMEQRAATDLSQVHIESAVDRGQVIRLVYVLAGVVAAFVLYLAISPKNPLASAARVLWPWANIPAPTRVNFQDIRPGDAVVLYGDRLDISADVTGLRSGETVTLFASTADGQVLDEAVAMTKSGAGNRFQCTIPPGNVGLQQNAFYRITAGDCTTPRFTVEVQIAPTIVVDSVEYRFPEYTGTPKRTIEGQGDVKALEGTQVTVHATANQEIKDARIDLNCAGRQTLPMQISGKTATGHFTLALDRENPTRPLYDRYQVLFTSVSGRTNLRPIRYRIDVDRDIAPDVRIVQPNDDEVSISQNDKLTIRVRAEDTDYALRRVALLAEKDGQPLNLPPLLDLPPPTKPWQGAFEASFEFEPAKLGLKASDTIKYWAEAQDNREMENREPAPNRSETGPRIIHITASGASGQPPRPEDRPHPANSNQNQSGNMPSFSNVSGMKPTPKGEPSPSQDKQAAGSPNKQDARAGEKLDSDPHSKKDQTPGDSSEQNQRNDGGAGSQGSNSSETAANQNDQEQAKDGNSSSSDDKPSEPVDGKTDPGDAMQKILDNKAKEDQVASNDPKQDPKADKSQDQTSNSDQNSSPDKKQPDQKSPSNDQQNAQSGSKRQSSPSNPGDQQDQPSNSAQQQNKSGEQQSGDSGKAEQQQGKSGQKSDPSQQGGSSNPQNQQSGGEKASAKQDKSGSNAGEQGQKSQSGKSASPQQGGAAGSQGQQPQPGGQKPDSDKQGSAGNQGSQPGQSGKSQNQSQQSGSQGAENQASGGEKSNSSQQKSAGSQGNPQGSSGQSPDKKQAGGAQEKNDGQAGGSGQKPDAKQPSGSGESKDQLAQAGGQSPDKKQDGGNSQSQKSSGGGQSQSKPSEKNKAGGSQSSSEQMASAAKQDKPQSPGQQSGGSNAGGGQKPKQDQKQNSESSSGGGGKESQKASQQQSTGGGDMQQKGKGGSKGSGPEDNSARQQDPGKGPGDNSQGKEGSPSPQAQGDSEGAPKPSDSHANQNDSEKSPSINPKSSQSQGDAAGDRKGGGGKGGGQASKNTGKGSSGSSSVAKDGGSAADEKGEGETGNKAGDAVQSDHKTGSLQKNVASGQGEKKPDASATPPSDPKSADSGETPEGNASEKQASNAGSGGAKQGQQHGSMGAGLPSGGNRGSDESNGSGAPPPPENLGADDPNLDFSRKQVDLALEHLKDQLAKDKPQLLKELGWSKEEAQRFLDTWRARVASARQSGPEGAAANKSFNEALKSLGLRPHGTQIKGGRTTTDNLGGLRDPGQFDPPGDWADLFRQYSRATAGGKSGQ